MSKLKEECGIFAIYAADEGINAAFETYNALFALQHRGQEACGIAVSDRGVIHTHKDTGLVQEVFNDKNLAELKGDKAIGHVRYSTTGSSGRINAQPISIGYFKGNFAVAHNGNLVNAQELRREIEQNGGIFQTTNDSEVIAYLLVRELINAERMEDALIAAMHKMKGAYSLVILGKRKIIAARDPNGFRPLCIGTIGKSYVFASESCALDAVGASFLRDVQPGELVVIEEGELKSYHCGIKAESSLCVFEYIYFARPDSVIDGASVDAARQEAGKYLSLEHPVGADIVIGVPDSGISAAIGYSKCSGIPFGVGLVKNKYIGRTFIQPSQGQRERSVKIKLNALADAVRGKRVILVDDSIVRGTTSARIVSMLREAGATEVHMRISSPPFLNPCFFGTDIPDRTQLVAHNRTAEEIATLLGADSLGYLSLYALHRIAVGAKCKFCEGCFTGKYPIDVPNTADKNIFERRAEE